MRCVLYARDLSLSPTGRGVVAGEIIRRLCTDPTLTCEVYAGAGGDLGFGRYRPAKGAGFVADARRLLWGLGREWSQNSPDVVWSATHLLPGGLPSGVPTVVTLLDLVWRDHPSTMRRANRWAATWGERSLRRADLILCISAFTQSRLLHYFPDLAERSRVVPLASNPRLAAVSRKSDAGAGLSGGRPWVVNVDTIEPRKDLGTLFEAMALCPDVVLAQCGARGWQVGNTVARASASPNCRLLGYVDEAALAGLYTGAVCAVFPSVYEGFHLAPLDAASLGCPVVLSDIPVHREVFGDAALYFPVGDVAGVAALIRTLAGDPTLRERYGRLGRARALSFNWDATARDVASALRSVVR